MSRSGDTIRVSNSSDPDQAQHFIGLDLGPNCLQRLSADETCKQRVKLGMVFAQMYYFSSAVLVTKYLNILHNHSALVDLFFVTFLTGTGFELDRSV